jgi:secreted trypsin-like serine protease
LGSSFVGVFTALLCAAWSQPSVRASAAPHAKTSIVGGTTAQIASLPFLVALYDPSAGSPAGGFFCGGVILDATHVATAAHCVVGPAGDHERLANRIAVLAGSSSLQQPQPGSVVDPVQSSSFDTHYNPVTSDYDVALLKLARPLWQGPSSPSANGVDTIAPVRLDATVAAAYADPNAAHTASVVSGGWGDVKPAPGQTPSYPLSLQAVHMPLMSDFICEEEYAAIEQPITARMICAGGGRSHRDTCYGDSGGPLLVDSGSPVHPPEDLVLVGLVDFGNGCAQSGYAGVYTRAANAEIARFLATGGGRQVKAVGSRVRHKKKRKKHRHRQGA